MRGFLDEQGRTRVFVEAYTEYAADGNLRRTRLIGREALLGNKRAVYGWKLTGQMKPSHNSLAVLQKPSVRIAR
jgi:hypothetical protein